MAQGNYRTVRLTGLGATLDDKIAELREIRVMATSEEQRTEIDELVAALENSRKISFRVCDAWGRRYDVE